MLRTITSFIEAVTRVAVAGEDDDFVPPILQTNSGVDDQAFGSANAQVGMQEDYGLARWFILLCHLPVWLHQARFLEVWTCLGEGFEAIAQLQD